MLWDSPHINDHGIYLWTLKHQGTHYINYIGETDTSFYNRMKGHMINTAGGNYSIPDIDVLNQLGESQNAWNGMITKGNRNKIDTFINNYQQLVPKIMNIWKLYTFSLDHLKVANGTVN